VDTDHSSKDGFYSSQRRNELHQARDEYNLARVYSFLQIFHTISFTECVEHAVLKGILICVIMRKASKHEGEPSLKSVLSVNRLAWKLLEKLCEESDSYKVRVEETSSGTRIVDAGIKRAPLHRRDFGSK
jgi:hypothetical protein